MQIHEVQAFPQRGMLQQSYVKSVQTVDTRVDEKFNKQAKRFTAQLCINQVELSVQTVSAFRAIQIINKNKAT